MIGVFSLQSSYSMLKNTIQLSDLIFTCKDNNYDFLALSDEYLHGIADLYKMTKDNKIKPIIGMKLQIFKPFETSFLIYVKDNSGYENLLELTYMKSVNKEITLKDLVERQKGLVFITSGFDSIVDQSILNNNIKIAEDFVVKMNNKFDDFYLGLAFNYKEQREYISEQINILSNNLSIPIVLVHQTSYLTKEDKEAYEALIKIENNNNTIDNTTDFSFLSKDKILKIYNKYPRLKNNAKNLINSINYKFSPPSFEMPKFRSDNEVSEKQFLVSLSRLGLKRRLKNSNIHDHKVYIKRLEHELKVINDMNFSSYFLIVYDFVKYAKNKNILVGPGRGSAAGSLVSYCLGITDIDPIKYDLMFERFLNPQRTSMPDIDMDFPDNKREEVINYVKEKYGENHICSISTYSTFALRSSIRDIARVTGIDLSRVTGIIQSVLNDNIDTSDEQVTKLINIASKIEGLPRQTGTHAAGIIVSKQNLRKHIPMQQGSYNFQQSQLNAQWLEKLGLIKIDFLGIRNLTIIADILDIINKEKLIVDIHNLDLKDKKTYETLSKGDTTGIFQLESSGMRNVLKKLKPTNFEDIIAVLALYRPGPMQNIDTYIKRRKGKPFSYLHKELEGILNKTYGIIIYQEQIMQIAQKFAGYDLFEADMLRVGVSKKDIHILENERNKFVNKSLQMGHSKLIANDIYNYIVKFADYGFNRSHSVSYSMIAYQMAYLKSNYYNVFMAVLLNHVIGNENQTHNYISEAKRGGLRIFNPNLNISTNKYIIKENNLLVPLTSIKGIGEKSYDAIVEQRAKGKFNDLIEIKQRLKGKISQNEFNTLISAGALDFLGKNRRTLLENSDLDSATYEQYMTDYKIRMLDDYEYEENMELEKQALGFNLKFNLFYVHEKEAKLKGYQPLENILNTDKEIPVLAMIKDRKEHITKNNKKMLFLTISDGQTDIDVTVFPKTFEQYEKHLKKGVYAFYLKSNKFNNERRYNLIKMALLKDS